jgi:hypothetical protein
MTTLADREWGALLELVAEATDELSDDEHAFALASVAAGDLEIFDYGEHLSVKVGGRRLLTVHKIVLARSNAVPQDN